MRGSPARGSRGTGGHGSRPAARRSVRCISASLGPLSGRSTAGSRASSLARNDDASHLRAAGSTRVELAWDPQPADGRHRHGEVVEGESDELACLGDDERVGFLTVADVEHRGPSPVPAGGHVHDVARLEPGQRVERLRAPVGLAQSYRLGLQLVGLLAQSRVLGEVAPVAGRGLEILRDRLTVPVDRASQSDDRTVGLELGETLLEQPSRRVASDPRHEVDGHVVGGGERRPQRIGAPGRETRHRTGVHARLPYDDRMPLDVDATSPGPPGELRVLAGCDVGMGLAVVFDELLDDHCACGHVDAEREGLRGEHDLEQAGREGLLDHRLAGRQHARVVGRHPPAQGVAEPVEVEHVVVGRHSARRGAVRRWRAVGSPRPGSSTAVATRRPGGRRRRSPAGRRRTRWRAAGGPVSSCSIICALLAGRVPSLLPGPLLMPARRRPAVTPAAVCDGSVCPYRSVPSDAGNCRAAAVTRGWPTA